MKFSYLLSMSLCTFLTAYAEAPMQETAHPLYSALPLKLAEDENSSLDEKLSFLDEDFNEELCQLDEAFEPLDSESEKNSMRSRSDLKVSSVDISTSLNAIDDNLKLEIIEEKAPEALLAETTGKSISKSVSESKQVIENSPLQESVKKSPLSSEDSFSPLTIESSSSEIEKNLDVQLDLVRAFAGSPLIYTLLFGMSMFAVFIWLYSLLSLKKTSHIPNPFLSSLQSNLNGNHFEEALSLCNSHDSLLCKMVASGIQSRKYGLSVMVESMKAEGKRSSMAFWQKIGLLNDIAVLAPMLGLLGTVIGMFYAFYDVNRSIESISSLFDGLGVSVGTTVAGLIVAILALILHSTAKYRLVRVLSQVENEAHRVASLIDNHTSLYTSEPN